MIKFVSKDTKDIKLGNKQVLKVYRGIDVVWENKKWVLIKSGTSPAFYEDDWTFNVKADEKIKIIPMEGLTLNIDIYEGETMVDSKTITYDEIIERNNSFEVNVLSVYARRQNVAIYLYK